MIVTDRVRFIMPKDREYQFPAMSILQAYVNGFAQKMKQHDVAGVQCVKCALKRTTVEKCLRCGETKTVSIATYKIAYSHDMDQDHWQMFLNAGLVLSIAPTKLTNIDVLIDMSDEKIDYFKHSGKHVSQVCGIMAGTGATPLPGITRRVPRLGDWCWATIVPLTMDGLDMLTGEKIIAMEDQKYTGFIGHASWETYLVASMGLPVLEIVPVGRHRAWLSKWLNGGYRSLSGISQVPEARESVEVELTKMAKRKGAVNV